MDGCSREDGRVRDIAGKGLFPMVTYSQPASQVSKCVPDILRETTIDRDPHREVPEMLVRVATFHPFRAGVSSALQHLFFWLVHLQVFSSSPH